jgi:dihydroorotase
MRRALEYASDLGVVIAQHCEDEALAAGGQMHEGAWSSRLGLAGQPALAEEAMVARDLALVRETGSPMHFLHISTAGSVELIARAKADGLPVTAEVAPHHLLLTDAAVAGYDAVFKVNPPLRTEADIAALRRGLANGVIDAVATDHAPHPAERKEEPFDQAPFGMTGLETSLALLHTITQGHTVTHGHTVAEEHALSEGRTTAEDAHPGEAPDGAFTLALAELFAVLSWRPARIAKLDRASGGRHGGPIEAGAPANLVVFDPAEAWVVDPQHMVSLSRNTPFSGMRLTGRVRHTIHEGEAVVVDQRAQR